MFWSVTLSVNYRVLMGAEKRITPKREYMRAKSIQLCPTMCNPVGCSLPGYSGPWDFPGKNTGVGCHFLLQGIFPAPGLNPRLLCLLNLRTCMAGRFFTTSATWDAPQESGEISRLGN